MEPHFVRFGWPRRRNRDANFRRNHADRHSAGFRCDFRKRDNSSFDNDNGSIFDAGSFGCNTRKPAGNAGGTRCGSYRIASAFPNNAANGNANAFGNNADERRNARRNIGRRSDQTIENPPDFSGQSARGDGCVAGASTHSRHGTASDEGESRCARPCDADR